MTSIMVDHPHFNAKTRFCKDHHCHPYSPGIPIIHIPGKPILCFLHIFQLPLFARNNEVAHGDRNIDMIHLLLQH